MEEFMEELMKKLIEEKLSRVVFWTGSPVYLKLILGSANDLLELPAPRAVSGELSKLLPKKL